MSLGRMFRFGERASFEVRAEFSNIFNRTYINNPTSTNARDSQRVGSNGQTIAGFGRINPLSPAPTPRQGTIVARVRF
jgi:hypothetical protein